MEQQAYLINAEQIQIGLIESRKCGFIDVQLQKLASTFHLITRGLYFKKARALFNF